MAKKYSEVEELHGMLERRREEVEELKRVDSQSKSRLVSTVQSICVERKKLIGQLRQLEEWIRMLGFEVPGTSRADK